MKSRRLIRSAALAKARGMKRKVVSPSSQHRAITRCMHSGAIVRHFARASGGSLTAGSARCGRARRAWNGVARARNAAREADRSSRRFRAPCQRIVSQKAPSACRENWRERKELHHDSYTLTHAIALLGLSAAAHGQTSSLVFGLRPRDMVDRQDGLCRRPVRRQPDAGASAGHGAVDRRPVLRRAGHALRHLPEQEREARRHALDRHSRPMSPPRSAGPATAAGSPTSSEPSRTRRSICRHAARMTAGRSPLRRRALFLLDPAADPRTMADASHFPPAREPTPTLHPGAGRCVAVGVDDEGIADRRRRLPHQAQQPCPPPGRRVFYCPNGECHVEVSPTADQESRPARCRCRAEPDAGGLCAVDSRDRPRAAADEGRLRESRARARDRSSVCRRPAGRPRSKCSCGRSPVHREHRGLARASGQGLRTSPAEPCRNEGEERRPGRSYAC